MAKQTRISRLAPWALVLLGLGLVGCGSGGAPRFFFSPTPFDPPPIPRAKPVPPTSPRAAENPAATAKWPGAVPLAPVVRVATPDTPPRKTWTRRVADPRGAPGSLGATWHRVLAGDTVYGIARRRGVPIRALIDANRLTPPYGLRVGQSLRLPNPRKHLVRRGDTLYGISRRYGVDVTWLVRLNRIAPPYTLAPGQGLILPVSIPAAARPKLSLAAARPKLSPAAMQRKLPPAVARSKLSPAATQQKLPLAVALPKPPPRAGKKFLWPLRGRLIAGYGPRKSGLHNDGINIAAPRGTPVRAAENGVVVYVGNELRGFGNLILLKHAGGWVTAYAHTGDLMVRRGHKVRRGQVIARVGSSGTVSGPQLHFEIRKGTRAVDPTLWLGPRHAARAK